MDVGLDSHMRTLFIDSESVRIVGSKVGQYIRLITVSYKFIPFVDLTSGSPMKTYSKDKETDIYIGCT